MKCPHCNDTLLMTERYNIEIDYCPSCRGIWLDKGELDKMIAYVEEKQKTSQPPAEPDQPYGSGQQPSWQKHDDDHYKYNQQKYHKHKRKGFLGDLFDFD